MRFAPLYDIASALPYRDEQRLIMAMKIGGSYRLRSHTGNSWPRSAAELGLEPDEVVERVHDLAAAVPDAFRDAIAQRAVRDQGSSLPTRLLDRVTTRAAASARLLRRAAQPTS